MTEVQTLQTPQAAGEQEFARLRRQAQLEKPYIDVDTSTNVYIGVCSRCYSKVSFLRVVADQDGNLRHHVKVNAYPYTYDTIDGKIVPIKIMCDGVIETCDAQDDVWELWDAAWRDRMTNGGHQAYWTRKGGWIDQREKFLDLMEPGRWYLFRELRSITKLRQMELHTCLQAAQGNGNLVIERGKPFRYMKPQAKQLRYLKPRGNPDQSDQPRKDTEVNGETEFDDIPQKQMECFYSALSTLCEGYNEGAYRVVKSALDALGDYILDEQYTTNTTDQEVV